MPSGPRSSAPEGPSAFLRALRDPGRNLKEAFKDKPLQLAERFGIRLPKKPVQVMIELGVLTEEEATERFGRPTPGLRELVEDVCLLEVKSAVAVANRGGGKALSIYTPVPTPSGWTTMGELRKGDKVLDDRGAPCTVTKAYRVMQGRPCYEVAFNDGSFVVADEDHLWLTSTAVSRHADRYGTGTGVKPQQIRKSFPSVKTTAQIRETLTIKAGANRKDFNHQIRNSRSLDLPEKNLLIDPYVLGLWLGDGHSHSGCITVGFGDESVVEGIERVSEIKGNQAAHLYRVEGLTAKLRELGVLNNKHVPADYLRASEAQRLDLLAGLMDSDGTVRSSSNNCQFDNTSERLADAVYELVVSLGWKATRSKRVGKLNGIEHKVVHRVSFRPTKQIFRNPRKAERLDFSVSQESRHLSRTIVGVRPVPSVPVRCIEVDSPNRMFLCGEQMVPTHNSYGVSFIEFYLWIILDFDALNLGGSELQADQVYQYLLGYIDSDPYWATLIRGDPMRERTYTVEDSWVRVLTASQKSVRSPHAGGLRKGKLRGGVLVIDEEAETDKDIVEAALPTINTASPSVNVRCSTFHNLEGSFQEVVDNHEEMGYRLYKWDIFDVCSGCDCVNECQSEEDCFREDHFEEYIDPDDGQWKKRLLHKAYSFLGQEIVFVRYEGGPVESTTLEDLYDRFDDGTGEEIIDVPKGWEIFDTVAPPGRWESNVQWTPLKAVSKHKTKVGLRTIQSGSGDAITVTDDHPFLVSRDRRDTFIPASEVKLGDNCVIPNVVKHLASESFLLDESVAYLVGQYLAEGNMGINAQRSKWVTLSGLRDPEQIVKAASAAFVPCRVRPHSGRGWNVHFGAQFYDLLASLGLGHETALNKRMPVNIMEWDESSTAALLSGLIDGDGTLHHSAEREHFNALSSVSVRVASKALVSQAQLCLRKLGMSGWVRYVGYYQNADFNQNFPLYGLEFSIREDKLNLFSASEKISNGVWPRTRNYAKSSGSRQKQVRSIKRAELRGQEFVYDVTTESQTFWCSGFRTHNCGGRAMYADGWISMEEILTMWKRMRRNHSRWEVEAMGSRPSTAGHVIKDLNKFSENIVAEAGPELYRPGGPVTICVDWGTGAAGVEVWQEQALNRHVQLHADLIKDNNQTQIFGVILGYAAQYQRDLVEIAADIGGGGNYMNKSLREEHRLPVRDVNFAEEKEAAVAAMNIVNEGGYWVIPAEHTDFIHQCRNWKRKNGRIQKGDDHLCDAAVCYFSKFIDRMGLSGVRVAPRAFSSNPSVQARTVSAGAHAVGSGVPRRGVAVVRSLRGTTRRRPR